jgi:hypothetical protein
LPVDLGAAPILLILDERGGRLPHQVAGVVDAAADGREGSASRASSMLVCMEM